MLRRADLGTRDLGVLANAGVPRGKPEPQPARGRDSFSPRSQRGRKLFFAVARGTTATPSEFNTLDLSPRFELSL